MSLDQSTESSKSLELAPLTKDQIAIQQEIIEQYHENGATKYHYNSKEWQEELDKGLAIDSTVAYLWQKKAMPYFKAGKYEVGMEYIDKAVYYKRERWQDYRAFIKCIFAKTYREAILDFEDCKKRYGNQMVMDHSYNFYIGLSYLQLNKFENAEALFKEDYDTLESTTKWFHQLDLFYYAITKMELEKYEEAIVLFDQALEIYPDFSDALYYKSQCLYRIGNGEEGRVTWDAAIKNGEQGKTIHEDNSLYERYPYQLRW